MGKMSVDNPWTTMEDDEIRAKMLSQDDTFLRKESRKLSQLVWLDGSNRPDIAL